MLWKGLIIGSAGASLAEGPEVPLKVANPENQFGDGRGARVDLDAEELMGINRVAGSLEHRLCLAQSPEHIPDFALETLHVFH